MPIFIYKARDVKGNLIEALKEAEDEGTLISSLKKEGLFPISIKEKKPLFLFKSKTKFVEKFTIKVATLLEAGFELPKVIEILSSQATIYWDKELLFKIKKELSEGKSLHEALSSLNIFSSFYISMVKAGESTASLGRVFKNLATFYEDRKELREKVISLSIYPIILFLVGMGTIIFLISYVLPKMLPVFADLGVRLPLVTKVFLSVGIFLSRRLKIIIILTIALILLLKKIFSYRRIKEKVDEFSLYVPFIGGFIEKVSFIYFSEMLSLGIISGLPLLEAFNISCGVVPNQLIAKKLNKAKLDVAKGVLLSESFRKNKVFSSYALELVRVAEESGRVEDFLIRISRSLSQETKTQIERFLRVLEPLIIFILAVLVGFLVMAVLLPIFQINLDIL